MRVHLIMKSPGKTKRKAITVTKSTLNYSELVAL